MATCRIGHSAENRLGGATCELLEHDRTGQRGEGPVRAPWPMLDPPDERDQVRQHRVARRRLLDGRRERDSRHPDTTRIVATWLAVLIAQVSQEGAGQLL